MPVHKTRRSLNTTVNLLALIFPLSSRRSLGFTGAKLPRCRANLSSYDSLPQGQIYVPYPCTRHQSRAISVSTALCLSSSVNDGNDLPRVEGLLPDAMFDRRSSIHRVLSNLRSQLPLTLTVPIDKKAGIQTYSPDCIVIGPSGETLASDLEEIVSLSSTIATAIGTAQRAGQLAATFVTPISSPAGETDGKSESGESNDLSINVELLLDKSLSEILVRWSTSIPTFEPRPAPKLVGSSLLSFNDQGLISEHRVQHVELDGKSVSAVGETLASLRKTVRRVTETSPWVLEAAEAAVPFLAQFASGRSSGTKTPSGGATGDNSWDSNASKSKSGERSQGASLFIAEEPLLNATNSSAWHSISRFDIDNYVNDDDGKISYPTPGSQSWTEYESAHRSLRTFVDETIPQLSGDFAPALDGKAHRDLFAPDAEMKAFDGSTIAKGGGRISDLYKAASSLRTTGSGVADPKDIWRMTDVSVDWQEYTVTVHWMSSVQLNVVGTDKFHLNNASEIQFIEQESLVVGGNQISDSGWSRAIISAVEGSRGGAGGEILGDVLRRISRGSGSGRSSRNAKETNTEWSGNKRRQKERNRSPQNLEKTAAASFYNIIRTLHMQLPSITESSQPALVPVEDFLSDDVELRGLLDETLARGKGPYSQVLSASTGSLRAAMTTKGVTSVKKPTSTIEVTPSGRIKVTLGLSLRIEAPSLPPLPGQKLRTPSNSDGVSLDIGIPFNLELVSVYKVGRNGDIVEHRIVENRVNGQRSPADVVSAWTKGAAGGEGSSQQGAVSTFLDAVKWARSVGGNQ